MNVTSTSCKTTASGAKGMGFKSQADKISHTLPATRHCCYLEVWVLAQRKLAPFTHSWHPKRH